MDKSRKPLSGGGEPHPPERLNELHPDLYRLDAYDYSLPSSLIAQKPVEPRDSARMMVLHVKDQSITHSRFYHLPEFLEPGDLLVVNVSRVIPARLFGWREPGEKHQAEILLIRPLTPPHIWLSLARPARKIRAGTRLYFPEGIIAEVIEQRQRGQRVLKFPEGFSVLDYLKVHGHMPIPPYIRSGKDRPEDREWYQTVYARLDGSIAAPTAGLHMTQRVQSALLKRGIRWAEIVLHVGPGTFRPVTHQDIRHHKIDPEAYEIPKETWQAIQSTLESGHRIIAVGTTTTRALEYAFKSDPPRLSGWTDLFIYPGYPFRLIRGLITNFHLPKSSLLMLVCAFGGYNFIMQAYQEAIKKGYRFYSYGDCMLILR